jgi:aspartate racemase
MAFSRAVGVIGGMGPEATVDLMTRVIRKTPAVNDQGHIRMFVDNNPKIPSRIAAIIEGTGESPVPVLTEMAQGLEVQGASFLAIPCNTAHVYYSEIQQAVTIPVLNMVALTTAAAFTEIAAKSGRRVGLLGSSALFQTGLYEPYCRQVGVECLYPDEQQQADLMGLINAIKAQNAQPEQLERYALIARALAAKGADCLIIACTELSVVDAALADDIRRIDALDVLVDHIIASAMLR